MPNVGYATVSVIPSFQGFNQKVRSAISGPLESEAKSAGSRAGGLLSSSFAKATAATAAAAGAFELGKSFYDAAIESQKVGKQTSAVIKSMGVAGQFSAKGIGNLATKLSLASGVDDEKIQSASNVLLTFGKVGKGVFDQAQSAALDMSVAMGTDLQGATVQVGKALNDPIKGVSALARVGVQFTDQQKDQIKTLVASGKTFDAQKIVLGELEHQFKGSAAAQATAGDKLKVAWGNVQEQLGAYLIPVVEKLSTWLADKLPGAMAWLNKATEKVSAVIKEHWPQIQKAITGAVQQIQAIVTPIVGALQTLWDNFGNNILEFVQRVWPRIQQIIEGAMTVIRNVIKVVTSLIQGDWSGVWDGLKGIVSGAWELIQGAIGTALEEIRVEIGIVLEAIGSIFKSAWDGLKDIAAAGWQKLTDWVGGAVSGIGDVFSGLADLILWPFKTAFNAIATLWNHTIGALSFHIPGWVPGIGGKGFDVPNIPTFSSGTGLQTRGDAISAGVIKMAGGGIIKHRVGGILANIGEGRYDEAVIPLRAGMNMAPLSPDHYGSDITNTREANVYIDGNKLIGVLRYKDRVAGGRLLNTSAA